MTSATVGVLTFHRCFNYGSYWQARCLVEGLRAMGHHAELLDHDSDAVARAEGRCLMQPLLPQRSPRHDIRAYKAKGRKFLDAFDRLPRSHRFPLHAPEAAHGYDTVVVGSDEVWNFSHPWYGGEPIFFGHGLGPARRISYAASFGNHAAAIDDHWAQRLGRFDAISVRDANSARLVTAATGQAPALVLDPCLQFADRIVAAPVEEPPYALIYGHHLPGWLAAAVRDWARARGLRLLSIGYRNDWADGQRLDAGPEEFAALMAGAAAVVTNFFHGCVFALLNGVPLVTAPSDYRVTKVRDLAAKLDVEDRVVTAATPAAALHALLDTPQDAASRIAALRTQSDAFLRAALR